jgi:hypothetical protein
MRALTAAIGLQEDAMAMTHEFVDQVLATLAWDDPDAVVARLVGSLVTDIMAAGGGWTYLQVRTDGTERVRLEVTDAAGALPRRRPGAADDQRRGLELVESLADTWGIDRLPGGRRLWMRLDRADWADRAAAVLDSSAPTG